MSSPAKLAYLVQINIVICRVSYVKLASGDCEFDDDVVPFTLNPVP